MSSRVQKGSTVFRPVVKSRARASTRQPSAAVEQIVSSAPEPASQQTVLVLETVPVEYASPRPSAPPVIAASIIGVPIRPVQLALPLIQPQISRTVIPEVIASKSSNLPTNPTTSLTHTSLVPLHDSNSPSESERPTTALTESNSLTTLPGDEGQPEGSLKGGTRPRKGTEENPKKPKRRRKGSKDGHDIENNEDGAPLNQSRWRASSGTPRPRKRVPSPPPYDPDADPGEDIDPTTVTMASLCADTGQGRVSSKAAEILGNHAAWKIKNREKRARMKMLMEAKKYGKGDEEENDAELDAQNQAPTDEPGPSTASSDIPVTDDPGSGFDYSQDLATSRYNVQVRIGPNGETMIDEESLVVDRVENDGTENYTHVVESDHTKFVNSGTYGKRYRGSRWNAEETELFYDALAQYGENYELIAYVLPGRDRKSCKNKFKAEDKKNHARINYCLDNSIPVDMKTLSRMTGKDFSGPVPEIRAPTPLPQILPTEEGTDAPTDVGSRPLKKRSRSKSHGVAEGGVLVVGDVENFES